MHVRMYVYIKKDEIVCMNVCSGTSACPPYHLAIVIGGLSAELTLKTVKLASTKYYDNLPTSGNEVRHFFSCLYVLYVCMLIIMPLFF